MDLSLVGRRISTVRKAKNLTQEELASLAGISATHIGVIERGLKMPNLGSFVNIANALEVSADVLLQDVVDRSYESSPNELSRLISKQTPQMQRKVYKAIKALVDED